jgi:hypothetical protein
VTIARLLDLLFHCEEDYIGLTPRERHAVIQEVRASSLWSYDDLDVVDHEGRPQITFLGWRLSPIPENWATS